MRVDEAWKTGLDVLAITDHIEYKTNREYISGDENTPYNLAKKHAEERGIILVKGTEITRKQPVYGHFNALFVKDANKLKVNDPEAAIKEAISQGAFIIWNHPGWAVDTCRICEFQDKLFKNKMIHGIDGVHGAGCAVTVSYRRPMTIIFAKDSSLDAIKNAMFNKRTIAFFNGHLAGDKTLLTDFCLASITVTPIIFNETNTTYRIDNRYDIPFFMSYDKNNVLLAGNRSIDVKKDTHKLKIKLQNVFINESQPLIIELPLN